MARHNFTSIEEAIKAAIIGERPFDDSEMCDLKRASNEAEAIRKLGASLDAPRDFEEGDLVEWKPGLKMGSYKLPLYGQPALAREIKVNVDSDIPDQDPVIYRNDMTIVLLMSGSLMEVRCESRRLRKYRPVPNN